MSFLSIAAKAKNPHAWVNFMCLIGFVVALTAPFDDARAQSGNVYDQRSVQTASPVVRGFVLQTRMVEVEATGSTRVAGPGIGALIGGMAGTAIAGKRPGTRLVLGLVGTILGGVGGQKVADAIGGPSAVEYIVQLEPERQGVPGRVVAVTQPAPGPDLAAGAPVYLVNTSNTWRVLPVFGPVASMSSVDENQRAASAVLARSYLYRTSQVDDRVAMR